MSRCKPAVAVAVPQLGERHQSRPERRGEVLALARPQADGHLGALQVAGGPVVHDGEARRRTPAPIVGRQIAGRGADHAGQFQFVIEGRAAVRCPDRIAVADDATGFEK